MRSYTCSASRDGRTEHGTSGTSCSTTSPSSPRWSSWSWSGAALGNALVLLPLLGVVLGGTWAAIAITVKRLHDLDRPGWHFWLFMIPLYNFYLGLVLLFKKGTDGPNEYGHDPLKAAERSMHLEA